MSLGFESRGPKTVMTHSRSTSPLKISNPIYLDDSDALCAMFLNPSGGLLGGDRLITDINLAENAHVVFTTPSASKVYRTNADPASHRTTVHVEEGGVLEYIPDHVIPHPGSSFSQSLTVNLEAGSRAIIFDGFSVGRIARNEKWRFKEFNTELEVNLRDRAVFRDRIKIQPDNWTPSQLGGSESANYVATMVVYADVDLDWQEMADGFTRVVSDDRDSVGAASTLSDGGCLVRYYTVSAHGLNKVTSRLWAMARRSLLDRPALELRKW